MGIEMHNPMAAAWKAYRTARQCRWHAADTETRKVFLPKLFSNCLATAWADVRKEQFAAASREADRIAAQLRDSIRASKIDLAKRMDPAARAERIRAMLTELSFEGGFASGWTYERALTRNAELRDELAILQAAEDRPSMLANIRTAGALAIALAQVA
jgi:hypothetical protein